MFKLYTQKAKMSNLALFLVQITNLSAIAVKLVSLESFWREVFKHFLFKYFVSAVTYFPPCGVSSVVQRFTTLFGMRRGSSTASSHRNKIFKISFCCL